MDDATAGFWWALWSQPWWVFDPPSAGAWEWGYHAFNLLEGLIWFAFAGLVVLRRWRWGRSGWELPYAAAFGLFGLSDFREAYVQSAQLVLFKAVVLVVLWDLRRRVIRAHGGAGWW